MLPLLRVALAGVFTLAGVAKLLDRPGTRQSLRGFALTDATIPVISVVLPVAEVLVAIALLPSATAFYGAAGASVLLLVFLAAIAVSLARGHRPDCHCFGQLHSEPIGWKVVARNVVLLLAAAVVLLAGGPDGGGSVSDSFRSLPPALRVAIAGALVGLVALAARRLTRPAAGAKPPVIPDFSAHALPVGAPAPGFSLPDLDGAIGSLPELLSRGRPVLLIFVAPNCGPCNGLLPDIERWQRDHGGALTIATITSGTVEANREKIGDRNLGLVLLQTAREVMEAFGLVVTPTAIVVNQDGTVGRAPALGDAAVRLYVEDIASGAPATATRNLRAPNFALPDLGGHLVVLSQRLGTATVLLFWDPACSFCQELLGHIRLWEARPAGERPDMVVISSGSVDDTRRLGLRSTIAIDRGFTTGNRYGLGGTPAAILIDTSGLVVSDPAIGAAAILDLLGQPLPPQVSAACPPEDAVTFAEDATFPPGSRPLRQDYVRDEPLADGSLLLYNSCRKQVLTLNPTGAYVWECCDGEHEVSAIAADIRSLFQTETPTAEQDVSRLINSLLRAGVLTALPERRARHGAGRIPPT